MRVEVSSAFYRGRVFVNGLGNFKKIEYMMIVEVSSAFYRGRVFVIGLGNFKK